VRALLECGEAQSPAMPRAVPRLRTDPLVWFAQVSYARLRRRYPEHTPESRRMARAWQTGRASAGPREVAAPPRPILCAVVAAWNEADVIWATVRNLHAQGVERVFVIDDDSSDGTADEARAAGATVLPVRSRGGLTEFERAEHMRRLVAERTAELGGDVWWLVVDADEFPRGPGTTIRDFVCRLPGWVDVVGSRVLEHVPCSTSFYRPRTHPASSIPLARWYHYPYCRRGHWKHQLFRVRVPGDVYPFRGGHVVGTADGRRAREAGPTLLMHHAPLRDRTTAEVRLTEAATRRNALADPDVKERLSRRLEIVDLVYSDRHEAVPNYFFPGERRRGLVVRDWRTLTPLAERELPRLAP
jgi:glycosyltransferase involved in cell wall biosynthesis